MIRFFRQIRQRLLGKNKIGKYLFYGLGEVLLMGIGILIALQVDARQQRREGANQEASYLRRLQGAAVKYQNCQGAGSFQKF
ncbi:MAG: hypothetical protein P8Z38_08440 [Robiginitalea sp.]